MRLKKIISQILCAIMIINLVACAKSSSIVPAASGKKLDGDIIIYIKEDSTYYLNTADMKEIKLCDQKVGGAIVDKINNNIIYENMDEIYMAPLSGNGEAKKIFDADGTVLYDLFNDRYMEITVGIGDLLVTRKFLNYIYDLTKNKRIPIYSEDQPIFYDKYRFVKYKNDDLWYLYNLEEERKIDIDGAEEISSFNDDKSFYYKKEGAVYVYDPATNESIKLNENELVDLAVYGQVIVYLELVEGNNILYSYNAKTKEKKETNLGVHVDNYCFNDVNYALWYTVIEEKDNKVESYLCKVTPGESPIVINNLVSKVHRGSGGTDIKQIAVVYEGLKKADGGGIYYCKSKPSNITDAELVREFSDELKDGYVFYCKDTESIEVPGAIQFKSVYPEVGIDVGIGYGNDTKSPLFFVATTVYKGEIVGFNRNLKSLYYNDANSSYALNWTTGEIKQLGYKIESILNDPDSNHLMYSTKNPATKRSDYVLDNAKIDGFPYTSGVHYDKEGYHYNDDYSLFYVWDDKRNLKVYKDGISSTIAPNVDMASFIYPEKVFYISQENVYLYDGESTKHIISSAEDIRGYSLIR